MYKKKLSFTKLSIWRSCCQLGRNTYDVHGKSANAEFGKTQFFEAPCTAVWFVIMWLFSICHFMFQDDRLIFCRFYPFSLPNDILHGLRVRRLSTGMNNALFNLCLWWVPAMPWRVFMNTSLSTEQAFIKVQSIEADLVKDKFLLNRTIHSLNIWYGFYIYVISKCHFVNKDSKKHV